MWLYEQIHGMPKDWHQLLPHNLELLRAARAGYLNPKPEDEKDKGKEDKGPAKLASLIFTSSKSVLVSGSVDRRGGATTDGLTSQDAVLPENGGAPAGGQEGEVSNTRKRTSPDEPEDPQLEQSNKRQALEKESSSADGKLKDKPKAHELSDLDREIALAKARAKANGEDVDIVVEYKFKVKDPAKARPVVRVVHKDNCETKGVDTETAQQKRERRKERLKNSKQGLQIEVWRAIPRSDEGASLSYLAKRHKNTVTLASKATETPTAGPTVTRATVRRIDAAGNPYEQTVTLEEGQTITDGEIISTAVILAPSAPESAPAQATPVKRRPPPPKRKGKGPGRGRKKGKLPIPTSTRPAQEGAPASDASGAVVPLPDGTAPTVCSSAKTDSIAWRELLTKCQGEPNQNGDGAANQDTEMVDSPAVHSDDDDGDEGDDDGEDGGDGDDGGDDEGDESEGVQDQDQDQEMKDVSSSEPIRPVSIEEPDEGSPASTSEDEPLRARFKQRRSFRHDCFAVIIAV